MHFTTGRRSGPSATPTLTDDILTAATVGRLHSGSREIFRRSESARPGVDRGGASRLGHPAAVRAREEPDDGCGCFGKHLVVHSQCAHGALFNPHAAGDSALALGFPVT